MMRIVDIIAIWYSTGVIVTAVCMTRKNTLKKTNLKPICFILLLCLIGFWPISVAYCCYRYMTITKEMQNTENPQIYIVFDQYSKPCTVRSEDSDHQKDATETCAICIEKLDPGDSEPEKKASTPTDGNTTFGVTLKELKCVSKNSDKQVCTTLCGHRYHASCLTTWIQNGITCPTCRTDMMKKHNKEQIDSPAWCNRISLLWWRTRIHYITLWFNYRTCHAISMINSSTS